MVMERLERLEYTSSSSSSLSSSNAVVAGSSDDQATTIRRDMIQIQALCSDIDSLWRSIASKPHAISGKGLSLSRPICLKVEKMSEEAESFSASLDKYMSQKQKRMQEAQDRIELLGRAVWPVTEI